MKDPSTNDNRTRILDAAEQLFAARGYAATSVREIVREAGVTNPMLYYYFGSKEDLFLHLIRERFEEYTSELGRSLEGCPDAECVLLEWCRALLSMTRSRPVSARMVYSLLFGPSEGAQKQVVLHESVRIGELLLSHMRRTRPDVELSRLSFALLMCRSVMDMLIFAGLESGLPANVDEIVSALVKRTVGMLDDHLPAPEVTGMLGLECYAAKASGAQE
jgi:AcrR family transcriptional regulator